MKNIGMGTKLAEIYGHRNISLLIRFAEGENDFIRNQSTVMIKEMHMVEAIKDRNKRNIFQTKMKSNIKIFFKDVFDNLICSPNLIAFYSGIEIDLIISKYIGIDTAFDKAAEIHSEKTSKDYEKLTSDLRECMDIKGLDGKVTFSEELKKEWRKATKYLGSMLIRTYKYNEFIYNQDTLINELDKVNVEYFNKSKDLIKWANDNNKDEHNLWNDIYSRVLIMEEYFPKHQSEMERLFPEEYKNDIKYIKTTITKLKNALEVTKIEIENRIIPEIKPVSKYQKYSGMNLKHWKNREEI